MKQQIILGNLYFFPLKSFIIISTNFLTNFIPQNFIPEKNNKISIFNSNSKILLRTFTHLILR